MSVGKARKLMVGASLVASLVWGSVSFGDRQQAQGDAKAAACLDCQAEEDAVLAADDTLTAAEAALQVAENLYNNCTMDCVDEEAALLMASDTRDAAELALDMALLLLEECENGGPPLQTAPQFAHAKDDGMHSVLVRK